VKEYRFTEYDRHFGSQHRLALLWRAYLRCLPIYWDFLDRQTSTVVWHAATTMLKVLLSYALRPWEDPEAGSDFGDQDHEYADSDQGRARHFALHDADVSALAAASPAAFGLVETMLALVRQAQSPEAELIRRAEIELEEATASLSAELRSRARQAFTHDVERAGTGRAGFVEQPLWSLGDPTGAIPSQIVEAAERIDASAGGPDFRRAWAVLRDFMHQPLSHRDVSVLVPDPEETISVRPLSPLGAEAVRGLATDSARLAALLARMALDDRTRLDLAAAPSAPGFREAIEHRGMTGDDLATLETRLAERHKSFAPNALWLVWVQTVHRGGIDAIQAELRSWLPADGSEAVAMSQAAPSRAESRPRPPKRNAERAGTKPARVAPPKKK
jgi:hypothetical protein